MAPLTIGEYNSRVSLEERQRKVVHELGHFYQAHRLLGINSDITFGFHYVNNPQEYMPATQELMVTPEGYLAESRTHGDTFISRLCELGMRGVLSISEARKLNFKRMLGGAEMEKAVYGDSHGEFDDVQKVRVRMDEAGLVYSDRIALEKD